MFPWNAKVRRINDFSYLDNMTEEELQALHQQIKQEINMLWEEDLQERIGTTTSSSSVQNERQQTLSNKMLVQQAIEKKNPDMYSSGLMTGIEQHGQTSDSQATLTLEKVVFDTSFEVCNDAIENNHDNANIWVLNNNNKYYHWLHTRSPQDIEKPDPIPITFSGNDKLSFKASFKKGNTEGSFKTNPIIRVTHKNTPTPYLFVEQPIQTNDAMEVTIVSTNQPYHDTIQYIQKFELFFEYSLDDGVMWTFAGSSINTLYITWDNPLYDEFDESGLSSKIVHTFNKKKKCILETLLFIGCKYAHEKGNTIYTRVIMPDPNKLYNEEAIVDAIFEAFKNLKVVRAREGKCRNKNPAEMYYPDDFSNQGMGYWRGRSRHKPGNDFNELRSVRYLLKYGEARCGEWTNFFFHILLVQGIKNIEKIAIDTTDCFEGQINNFMNTGGTPNQILALVEQYCPGDIPYLRYSDWNRDTRILLDVALQGYTLRKFMVKDCEFIYTYSGLTNHIHNSEEKKSKAQGNDDTINVFNDHVWARHKTTGRFYDASYGVAFSSKQESTLANYCDKLFDGLFFITTDKLPQNANDHLTNVYIRHAAYPVLCGSVYYKIIKNNMYVYLHTTKADI